MEDVANIIAEWSGKEIIFPQGLSCTSMLKDTPCVDLHSDNYKILFVVDSLGCTSCSLNLFEWKMILKESDTVFLKKPEFLFFFQPKMEGEKELKSILNHYDFSYPVFIDKENQIDINNKFSTRQEYKCFLLDKENKVVLVGSPALNPRIWSLFKKVINESETKLLTMEKEGEFISSLETTDILPYFLLKKRDCKNTKLI